MNIVRSFFLFTTVSITAACDSVGPTLIIQTDQPAEDFVVICSWSTGIGLAHGGGSVIDEDVHVIKSGEKLSCGFNPFGRARKSIMHPVYIGSAVKIVDGVQVIKQITKLQRLDELKAKFEAGYWGKFSHPEIEYARSLTGICGISRDYLEKYSQVKKVSKEHFFMKYNDFFMKCNREKFNEIYQYSPLVAKDFNLERIKKLIWNPQKWSKYE